MRLKFLIVIAASLLLAACTTEPTTTAGSDQGGSSTGASASTSVISSPAAGSQEELLVEVGDRIFFDFDKSNVRADQRAVVDNLAAWLNANPQVVLTIEGHADERGTREYNLALGERRANAVREYLIAVGIAPSRLNTISYGKERPAVLGSNEAAYAQNRRDVFVVQ
tara:strand:+ start:446 stop:946 length:501 start_codon:yes stop_codon:yes gene_type:complete